MRKTADSWKTACRVCVERRAPRRGRGRTASRRRRARRAAQPDVAEPFDHGRRTGSAGWPGSAAGARRRPSCLAQAVERRRVVVVAVDVAQPAARASRRRPRRRRRRASRGCRARAAAAARALQPDLRHADDGHVEVAAPRHRVQRGKDLLVGEVAAWRRRRPARRTAAPSLAPGALLEWPPNS